MDILLVEDILIEANQTVAKLYQLGYAEITSVRRGEEAIRVVREQLPELILMDIELHEGGGKFNGFETVKAINKIDKYVPIIYLSGLDGKKVKPIKRTGYVGYLPKPFNSLQLKRYIEFAKQDEIERLVQKTPKLEDSVFLPKRIGKDRVLKADILLVKGGRNTFSVRTEKRKYEVSGTIRSFCDYLNYAHLIRVHKSYAININHIESIDGQQFIVGGEKIPFSKRYIPNLDNFLDIYKY